MSKRAASNDLNQDNWDQEDEPEEPQEFQKASADVLESRVIITAKRRIQDSNSSGSKPSPFSNFSGFGKATSTSNLASPFAFLNQNKSKTDDKDKNGKGTNEHSSLLKEGLSQTKSLSSSSFLSKEPQKSVASPMFFDSSKTNTDSSDSTFKPFEHIFKTKSPSLDNKKSQNLESLKELNLSCSSWIAKHLEKNPYCILTPIFNDYKKHLEELNLDKEINKVNDEVKSDKTSPTNNFKFGSFLPSKPFNLQFNNVNTTFESSPAPFSLNRIAAKPINLEPDSKKDDEESEEPPTNDFTPVVEEDSIFDIKCKIFVKKEDKFVSRGVGTLFLKPVKDSKKTQVVVRAHTSLGNILLNILLSPGMPIQKTGKNNAMLVCIPTPESEPPPVPVLIRVKTSEECDNLIKKLEECRDA
ncbi:conserved hypothetical protein [Pediculus humanus corporis]|uniref:RanBD1 domain-containing protein n=1 Tax=Pediculus humanus subsp. corporis TaxID=121224 RepID=E0VHD0_PEDHC|nr:uncharacterized protein Phum_PHUM205450 [Pediculus humanus corporis]EEB12786.1 conserved hypothetical protein [Pediculus humanus corporis]